MDIFLDMIELKMGFEQEFDITIPDKDFDRIQTVDDLVKCIERIKP
jgi:acyl carrier protein